MNKELMEKLENVADFAQSIDDKATAGVIYSLLGAIATDRQLNLLTHVVEFSKQEIELIKNAKAQRN